MSLVPGDLESDPLRCRRSGFREPAGCSSRCVALRHGAWGFCGTLFPRLGQTLWPETPEHPSEARDAFSQAQRRPQAAGCCYRTPEPQVPDGVGGLQPHHGWPLPSSRPLKPAVWITVASLSAGDHCSGGRDVAGTSSPWQAIWDCSARIWRGEAHSCHGRSSPAAAPAGVAAHGFTALCPDPVVAIEPISAG
jgi:hypothetical protein